MYSGSETSPNCDFDSFLFLKNPRRDDAGFFVRQYQEVLTVFRYLCYVKKNAV